MLDINLFRNDLAAVDRRTRASAASCSIRATFRNARGAAQGHPDAHAGSAGQAQRLVEADRHRQGQGRGRGAAAGRSRRLGRRAEAAGRSNSNRVQAQLREFLLDLPNLTHPSTPVGKSSDDNVEVRRWGTPPEFDFTAKDHTDLGEALGLLDFAHRRQDVGRALFVSARRSRAPASRARAVHARHAYARAWLHGVLHALHRQRRRAGRHDAVAEVRG